MCNKVFYFEGWNEISLHFAVVFLCKVSYLWTNLDQLCVVIIMLFRLFIIIIIIFFFLAFDALYENLFQRRCFYLC